MKRARHLARKAALQALYQLDVQRAPSDSLIDEAVSSVIAATETPVEATEYGRVLTAGVWAQRERYDQIIAGASDHWEVSRMAVVDRNILRLALYELIERQDVPPRVVIDEAVEIGREFGDAETPQFINGVLDAIWKNDPTCRLARPLDEPAGHGKTS